MALTREKLRSQIRSGDLQPVYVLYGEETYLRDNAAKAIANAAFVEGDLREMNDGSFSLSDPANILTALNAANELPMMSTRRLVRVTDIRVAASSLKDTLKEDAEAAVSAYLADPSPSTIFILVADELNGNRKLGKLLKSQPAAVEFKRFDQQELRTWASAIFDKAETKIDTQALRSLVELTGSDVRRLETESAKLCTAALPDRSIDEKLVRSMVRSRKEIQSFDFARNLIEGSGPQALTELRQLLSNGEEPLALLGLLGWQFRDALKRSGTSSRSAYAIKLATAIEKIAATDLAIKTSVGGGGPKGTVMQLEMLVCELASN